MKIWVLNPPFLPKFSRPQRSPAVTKSGTLYFPIWLAYCAGVLEQAGHDVTLTDAPARCVTLDQTLELARSLRPHLIVMDTSTPSIENDLQVAKRLKDVLPGVFIIAVGTHVSALAEETLRNGPALDAVARAEYEYTVRDLAACLPSIPGANRDTVLAAVSGISFRTTDGRIVNNNENVLIPHLDELPWVTRMYKKFLHIEDYFNPNALFPMLTLITSRGCPFRCSFCVYPQALTGRKYRFRSIKDVVDEIEFAIAEFPQAQSVFFEDDTLTADKKRCIEFSDELIRRGIRIPWTANSRVELDFEGLQKIRQAGCRQLCVGFESGDQGILDEMRKGTKVERMHQFMADARRAGVLVHGCFMVGFPSDTPETVRKTVDLALTLNPDTVQFYPVMVYPGTEAYEDYKQKGWITAPDYAGWLTPDGLHNCVVRNAQFTSTELVRICDDARRRFYLRPGYIAYKALQALKSPSELARNMKAARTFVKYLIQGSKV
jgi:radical SAM superfamily enzyme YgiQ (UPF0313 family)